MDGKFVLGIVVAVGAAASALAASRAAPDFTVRQVNRLFVPGKLTVPVGSGVRFSNEEKVVHHAFVDSPTFKVDSGDIAPGEAPVLLFDKEGRFLVRCAIHPQMKLDIEVTK